MVRYRRLTSSIFASPLASRFSCARARSSVARETRLRAALELGLFHAENIPAPVLVLLVLVVLVLVLVLAVFPVVLAAGLDVLVLPALEVVDVVEVVAVPHKLFNFSRAALLFALVSSARAPGFGTTGLAALAVVVVRSGLAVLGEFGFRDRDFSAVPNRVPLLVTLEDVVSVTFLVVPALDVVVVGSHLWPAGFRWS